MRVLVSGASGFVGERLSPALQKAGHDVWAMTRYPDSYRGAGQPVGGDVLDAHSVHRAMVGCDAAYYLVHSLGEHDFLRRDADAAVALALAAEQAGMSRIVYLGGLGDGREHLSDHLSSRREVGRLLAGRAVPVTTLRAGVIIGRGGVSWEMTRQLVEHLPVLLTPRWARTRTQPIAIDDVVRYLVGVLDVPETVERSFDIGGPEVLAYLEMLRRLAAIQGRRRVIVPTFLLSPRMSSRLLSLVTDIDPTTGRALIDSMSNEVVVRDDSIRRLVPHAPMGYDDAVAAALGARSGPR